MFKLNPTKRWKWGVTTLPQLQIFHPRNLVPDTTRHHLVGVIDINSWFSRCFRIDITCRIRSLPWTYSQNYCKVFQNRELVGLDFQNFMVYDKPSPSNVKCPHGRIVMKWLTMELYLWHPNGIHILEHASKKAYDVSLKHTKI